MADKEITIKVTTEADSSQVDDLKNKVDELSVSADTASESIDNVSTSADNLSGSIDNVDGEGLSQASSDADSLSDSVSNADSEVQGLGNDLSLLETSALLDISGQIGSFGDTAEGMAQEMNTAAISVGQLATQTAIAEPQMVSLINNISNATFPQEEALAYVGALNQMGVSSDKLGDSATNMDRINDATGIGYQNVMQLTAGLRSVGISADSLPTAFNAIAYAESNVYDGTNTLTQVMKTQAGTINEYGLNVDQLAVILSTLQSQTGLTGKKLSSELSQRLKDCNGDVGALEQSLGLANGTLQNASQITGQYDGQLQQLADEEAEHKTLLDHINAGYEDLQLALSPVLSPVMSFIGLIGQAGSWAVAANGLFTLTENFNKLRNAEILSTIATKASAAAQWLLNIAMDANPIMLVVLAIIALVAILGYLYFNNEQVRAAIDGLGQTFMWVGQIMYTSIINAVNWIIGALQNLWTYVITLGGLLPENVSITGNSIIDTILRVLAFIATLPVQIGIIFINTIARVLGFGNNFAQRMISGAVNAVNGFMTYISQLPGKLMGELNKMLEMAKQFIMDIANMLTGGAAGMVVGWITGSGEHSPGYMYDAFSGELEAMENAPRAYMPGLTRNMGQMATSMIKGFNDNTDYNMDFDNTANASIINNANSNNNNDDGRQSIRDLILNIGSVDDEERIQQILEALRRYLAFDNETAGRTT